MNSPGQEPEVIVSRSGSLGRVSLNRPKALNALTLGMVRQIQAALDEFEAAAEIAAVLVTGQGERGLCAGGDIRAIHESGRAGTALAAYMSSLTSPAFAATQYALLSSLYALPGKIIGGLSGKIVDTIGYPAFFVSTSTIGVPVAILCLIIWYASARQPEVSPQTQEAQEAG